MVDRRHVTSFYGAATARMPNTRLILQGIEDRHLTMHYARWQYMTGTATQGHTAGPFLELAYWVGATPGVAPTQVEETANRLDRYRDSATPNTDRWVMFHLHFDVADPNMWLQDRTTGEITYCIGIISYEQTRLTPNRSTLAHPASASSMARPRLIRVAILLRCASQTEIRTVPIVGL